MSQTDKHKDFNHQEFFRKVEIPYEKTKEEIWDILSNKLDAIPQEKAETKIVRIKWVRVLAAALVLLMLSVTSYLRLYTQEIECRRGEHISHILPDGSVVDLNAESHLAYNPYWWKFKREVLFEGEAFFTIEKGQHFAILSKNGTTEILGTSFNIYSRDNEYKVFCNTGKVKVSNDKSDVNLIINPGEIAVLNKYLKKGYVEQIEADLVMAWQNNKFNFTSAPLKLVIAELERQYNVKIKLQFSDINRLTYTGYFAKSTNVESSLNLICKSFNLSYKKNANGIYLVSN